MARVTPIGALLRGLAAGAAGSMVQSGFFKIAASITPQNPPGVFTPPEARQQGEPSTETIARRAFEQLAMQRPLSPEEKALGGQLVHVAFGAGWGGLYGLLRESLPAISGPVGVVAFSAAVWMVSDNGLLPAFKLAAPATAYPLKTHAFALGAHVAYGAGVWSVYEALRPQTWATITGAIWGLVKVQAMRKVLPRAVRPSTPSVIAAVARAARRPIARAAISGLRAAVV